MGGGRYLLHGAFGVILTLAAMPAVLGGAGDRLMAAGRPVTKASPSTSAAGVATTATPTPSTVTIVGPPALSLDIAVGQMMAASFSGPAITPGLRQLILEDKVGAVLLFQDNFGDATSLGRLTADLQALGVQAGLPAPLLVTLDQEGGRVARVTDGIAALPSQLELGRSGPAALRQSVARMAAGLHGLGVALDLAPVADLRSNSADAVIGDRSYGGDPAVVGPLVAAAVQGMHDGGVATTLKHFPGLGGAAGDPHHAIPTDYETVDQWAAGQALSFGAGIEAGADAVMTTSVVVPGLDPTGTPALFSRAVVTGLLRERLHFQGVIVTDGLGMGGITAAYSLSDATVEAVRAGNDLVLLNSIDAGAQLTAIAALKQAVLSGSIPLEQVRASAGRVIALRARWPRWAAAAEDPQPAILTTLPIAPGAGRPAHGPGRVAARSAS